MSTKRIAVNAVLVALYVVLSFISLNFGFLKLSFALLPIFLCALCFGAADAAIVALLASFICQMISYGFGPTTLMWMLPPVALGVLTGLYARAKGNALTGRQYAFIIVLGCLVVTTLNTAALLIDGLVYGYPVAFTFSVVALRYLSSIVMAIIYRVVAPRTVMLVRRSGLTEGR